MGFPSVNQLRDYDASRYMRIAGLFLIGQGQLLEGNHNDAHSGATGRDWRGDTRNTVVDQLEDALRASTSKNNEFVDANACIQAWIDKLNAGAKAVVEYADQENKDLVIVDMDSPAYLVLPRYPKNPESVAKAPEVQAQLMHLAAAFMFDAGQVGIQISEHGDQFAVTNLPVGKPGIDGAKFLEQLGIHEAQAAASAAPAFLGGLPAGILAEALALPITALGYEATVIVNGKA